jgi:CHAD domain-containing protein
VAEIHQLRLAVERTGAATPKIQITLQRLQLQEQKVTRISEQLADVRKQITALSERNNFVIAVQNLNAQIDQEQDATHKKALQEQLHGITTMAEEQGRMVQQLRTQEAELAGSLRLEQAKADELNDHLTALERSLDPPPAK